MGKFTKELSIERFGEMDWGLGKGGGELQLNSLSIIIR